MMRIVGSQPGFFRHLRCILGKFSALCGDGRLSKVRFVKQYRPTLPLPTGNVVHWSFCMTRAEIDTCEDIDGLYERLGELSAEIGWVEARIWDLQEARGNPELREQNSDYWAGRL